MSEETCNEDVKKGHGMWADYSPCGKPVKSDGLCGLHLGAKKRRQSADAKSAARSAHRQEVVAALTEHLGFKVWALDGFSTKETHYTLDEAEVEAWFAGRVSS